MFLLCEDSRHVIGRDKDVLALDRSCLWLRSVQFKYAGIWSEYRNKCFFENVYVMMVLLFAGIARARARIFQASWTGRYCRRIL